MIPSIKIILISFLIGSLQEMPYGYYQVSKIILFIGFMSMSLIDFKRKVFITIPLYAASAIVFNPFTKFAFSRDQWQVIDKIGIAVLIITLCYDLFLVVKRTKSIAVVKRNE